MRPHRGILRGIEEIDLSPILKWKVAFLYQNRQSPILFPIFTKEALFFSYADIDPRAKLSATPYYVMYETLMERHRELGDVFDISRVLWGALSNQPEADRSCVGRSARLDSSGPQCDRDPLR